jgi:phenylpropionate dioxygenase-like ring-hydroxylating dioxygenase large terminal subunit
MNLVSDRSAALGMTMEPRHNKLRNFWYIGCASSRLGRAPRSTRILSTDLVLFRDGTGRPCALLDRCCHRGVKLSLGKTTEGLLACGYHGWRYDGSGRCVHIPSLPLGHRIPEKFEVAAFPTSEGSGYVWVWMGDSQPVAPPEIPNFEQYRWRQGCFTANCDWMKMVENNLDWCHVVFAHAWTHPVFFIRLIRGPGEFDYEVRTTENGMVTFTPPTRSEEEPLPDRSLAFFRFELPDRLMVRQYYGRKDGRGVELLMYLNFVPTTSNACRAEWMFRVPIPLGRKVSWSRRRPKILIQDKELLESSQGWYDREGSGFEHSVEADVSQMTARRVVEMASDLNSSNTRDSLPRRRVVHVQV